jgi:flavin-dependent dehydrogenase
MTVMMKYIQENPKQIPVAGEYDVVVAGGGVAGIAAALAAARQGAKTMLIEKEFALGVKELYTIIRKQD